jgi:putative FmdB family regulatory protein
MPIYEYECGSCGGRFEVSRKFSDPAVTVCGLCNATNVRKVLSTPAFVLKGGGWYATDYPSADRKQGSEADKPAADTKQGSEAEKPAADSKPAGGCASGTCPATSPSKGPA